MSRLFVFLGRRALGGIETLLLKAANELVLRGEEVLLAGAGDDLSHLLIRGAEIIHDERPLPIARRIDRIAGTSRSEVTLVSLHPWELVRASLLNDRLARLGYHVRGFHLVTHSRAFFFDTRVPWVLRLLKRAFFRSPPASTYFMNIAARDAHAAEWRCNLSAYPVLTLPLGVPQASWKGRLAGPLRIVSVGRLVGFKGYNRAAADVTRKLRQSGMDVSWDIWGDGPEEDQIAATISAGNVEDHVRLRGMLPYEQFDATVSRYDLFVGMGTALLEAALTGMPAITSLEGTLEETYGFLFETPLDSVGDVVAGADTQLLAHVITRFSGASEAEAAEMGARCRQAALDRSSSVDDVAEAIEAAQPWQFDASDRGWLRVASVVVAIQRLRGL